MKTPVVCANVPNVTTTHQARFHTSITERGDFRTCRRRWYLGVVENLQKKDAVPWALIFGEVVHSALEAYYKNKRSLKRALLAFDKAWQREDDNLRDTYMGLYMHGIEQEWAEYREKGKLMLQFYDVYDRASPFWAGAEIIEVINAEERLYADILDPGSGARLEGLPLLSGRPDLIIKRKNGIWIIDHKTAATAYSARALDVDDQLTGLAYLYWRNTGIIPRGCLYNALIKEPPSAPRILKDGSLSKDKSQRTTYDLYVREMRAQGIHINNPDYAEILDVLEEKGWSQFFLRDEVNKSEAELESFEFRLYHEYQDMQEAIGEEGFRYPNPSQQNCSSCSVVPVCQAMEEQGDVDYVRDSMYVEVDPRVEVPKKILAQTWKGV